MTLGRHDLKPTTIIVIITIPGDSRAEQKEHGKLTKYQNLKMEVKELWKKKSWQCPSTATTSSYALKPSPSNCWQSTDKFYVKSIFAEACFKVILYRHCSWWCQWSLWSASKKNRSRISNDQVDGKDLSAPYEWSQTVCKVRCRAKFISQYNSII